MVHPLGPAVLSLVVHLLARSALALWWSAAPDGAGALVVHQLGLPVLGLWFSSAICNWALTCRTAPARRQPLLAGAGAP